MNNIRKKFKKNQSTRRNILNQKREVIRQNEIEKRAKMEKQSKTKDKAQKKIENKNMASNDEDMMMETNSTDVNTIVVSKNKNKNQSATISHEKVDEKPREVMKFTPKDKGPFVVFLEKENINVVTVGKMLRTLNIIDVMDIVKVGNMRVRVEANDFKTANRILASQQINILGKYKTFVPLMFIQTVVVVSDIPVEIPLSEIMEEMVVDGIQIMNFERMNKWNNEKLVPEPCDKIKLTLRTTSLPNKITMYGANVMFDYYIPAPILCKKCLRYGHVAKICRGKSLCHNCAEEHEQTNNCPNPTKCKHCKLDHKTTDFRCKERQKQRRIKRIMVVKRLPYNLALKEERDDNFPQQFSGPSFADIVKLQNKLKNATDEKDEMKEFMGKIKQLYSSFGASNSPGDNDSFVIEVGKLLQSPNVSSNSN